MLIELAERRLLPDKMIRYGIRRLLAERLRQQQRRGAAALDVQKRILKTLRSGPIAESTKEANQQHYEVPADFFLGALGPRLKYSCCYWPDDVDSLGEAEDAMLELTCGRAEISDGMRVLDLGCGWGSFSLWLAERMPKCEVVAVSNSHGQRNFIQSQSEARGLKNLKVITANIADFDTNDRFDRVVSIEMFEHVRNYQRLMANISRWLAPFGKLFVHIFCHREFAYLFEPDGRQDWMARHFFTGGVMPSQDLLSGFQQELEIEETWTVNGTHYGRTLESWLANIDRNRDALLGALGNNPDVAPGMALQRWRMFMMSCAELFNYREGKEWYVAHYRFRRDGDDTV